MRIRVRRTLTSTAFLGAADHRLLARLRAAAILLRGGNERGDWVVDIFLHLRDDGQLVVLFGSSLSVKMHIAATAGIPFDPIAYESYLIPQRQNFIEQIHRAASAALVPNGLPPGLAHLLHQTATGAPVPDTLAAEVEGAGWILDRLNPILWPNLEDDISAHERLDQVAASGIFDPDGAALLGPLARFVAEAAAQLVAPGR